MADIVQGTDGPSGGPNDRGKPFAIEQAERELADARSRLKASKQGSADRKAAEDAVKAAERQLEKLTEGSLADRRKASQAYMKKYFDKLGGDWVQELYKSFPDLRDLVEKAIEKGWINSVEGQRNFLDAFYKTDFYTNPNRGIAWFEAFKLEKGNPQAQKQFADSKQALHDEIRAAAKAYGINVADKDLDSIARAYLYGGWASSRGESGISRDLDSFFAKKFRKQSGQYEDSDFVVGGTVAENVTLLKNLARDMGLTFDNKWFTRNAAKLTEARQNFSLRDAQNLLLSAAREQYGLGENDLGFTENDRNFRTLRSLVSQAIRSGGETARRLLENSRIQGLLAGWEDADGRSMAEVWGEFLASAKVELRTEARKLGLNLDEATLDQLSREYQYRNWDDNQSAMLQYLAGLVEEPGRPEDPTNPTNPGDDGGDDGGDDTSNPGDPVWNEGKQATLERQLRSWARNYGVDVGDEWFKSWVNKIVLNPQGGFTQDDALNEIIKLSRQSYAVFSEEINDGMTVRDLAGGYLQRMARLLEIESDAIDLNDPLMQKALTGRAEDGKPTLMSLYDFASAVRQDDRWQATDNALNSYASTANEILKRMGFVA